MIGAIVSSPTTVRPTVRTLAIIGLFLVAASGSSRTKSAQRSSAQRKFDLAQTKLPHNFTGDDFMTAFRSLEIPTRGEFETTAEFERRSSVVPRRIVAFVLPRPEVKYDADRSELTIMVPSETAYVGFNRPDNSDRGFLVRAFVASRRSYVATNAFGASVAATEIERVRYSVISENKRGAWEVIAAIKTPPANARLLKPKVRALLVCEIGEESRIVPIDTKLAGKQFGATGEYFSEATLDDPTEILEYHFSIRARVVDVWIFRADSGEVLLKAASLPKSMFNPDEPTAEFPHSSAPGSQPPSEQPPAGDRNATRVSLVAVGMSKSEVQSILGKPDEQEEGWFGNLQGERWTYRRDGIVLEFALPDGTLRTVRTLTH